MLAQPSVSQRPVPARSACKARPFSGGVLRPGIAQFPDRPQLGYALPSKFSRKRVTMMGNKATNGPFAPLVRIFRDFLGPKEFNKFRGQMISLHSQVIKDFGKQVGAENKQVQGLIRLAKKNGEKLGFLA